MSILKEKLAKKVPGLREDYKKLVKEHGAVKLAEVTVETLYGGMRGVKGLICDTSSVPPDKGLLIRGKPIGELAARLPEEIWYLLLMGELPTAEEVADIQKDWASRAKVPSYVFDVLKAMPKTSHPMAMFNTAILVLENESVFR